MLRLSSHWLLPLALCLGCAADPAKPEPVEAEAQPATSAKGPATAKTAKAKDGPAAKKEKRKTREQLQRERRTYRYQLDRLDKDIKGLHQVAEGNPTSFMNWERIARAHVGRARLTGDYSEYEKAEEFFTKAFAIKEGVGPWMSHAKLNYTLHRLEPAAQDLARARAAAPLADNTQKANFGALEANIAFQSGDYRNAEKLFAASLELNRGSNLAAYAVFLWKTGRFDEAEATFKEYSGLYHGKPTEPIAWIHLQYGLMDLDRGRYDDALAHYKEGMTLIDGYWLIDEHIAEILTLTGKTEEAKKLYLDIIERTNNPEFMDAMAGILTEEGKPEEAKQFIGRARKRYDEQMAMFPEAAYGHALGHFLEFGNDIEQTVDLAEKNHALRPNAEAKTLLAQAYLKAGRAKDALKIVKQAIKTPAVSADLFITAAEAHRAAGKTKAVVKLVERAQAVDPSATLEDEPAPAPSP